MSIIKFIIYDPENLCHKKLAHQRLFYYRIILFKFLLAKDEVVDGEFKIAFMLLFEP